MSLEGWIFMVGLRVFDVGALIVWLVWFFKLRDDDEDDSGGDDQGGGGEPPEPEPRGPGGLQAPLPDARPWPHRRRDGHGDGPPATRPGRPPVPRPGHAPARVRRPPAPPPHRVR
jgi:hypothetical protein